MASWSAQVTDTKSNLGTEDFKHLRISSDVAVFLALSTLAIAVWLQEHRTDQVILQEEWSKTSNILLRRCYNLLSYISFLLGRNVTLEQH